MKKMIVLLVMAFIYTGAAAQETEVKVKKTSSPKQKVQNVFRKDKDKKYNGVKVKSKRNGRKTKAEVKKGEVEIKSNTFVWRKDQQIA